MCDKHPFYNRNGSTGATGAAGATILDSYDTVAQLIAEHPSGTAGDAYLVDGELYVWSDEVGNWVSMGSLVGPAGPEGPTGPEASSFTIIPFASQQAPYVQTTITGAAANVALIGFGYMQYSTGTADVAFTLAGDGTFNLASQDNRQIAFSLPYDMKLNSIYITVGNFDEFIFPPTGTLVFPYVQIYSAPADSNYFTPLPNAFARPEQGIDPNGAPAATMRQASKTGLDIELTAGTRIAIGGLMEITGDTAVRNYYLYFTGGLGLSRWVRE